MSLKASRIASARHGNDVFSGEHETPDGIVFRMQLVFRNGIGHVTLVKIQHDLPNDLVNGHPAHTIDVKDELTLAMYSRPRVRVSALRVMKKVGQGVKHQEPDESAFKKLASELREFLLENKDALVEKALRGIYVPEHEQREISNIIDRTIVELSNPSLLFENLRKPPARRGIVARFQDRFAGSIGRVPTSR